MSASATVSRRSLFRAFACGCAAASAGLGAGAAFAASPAARTTLSADQALARLKEGNANFAKGGACVPLGGLQRVAELAQGQAPFAVIIACSDSRTPPEHLFSSGLGELFIIRVAGNTIDSTALGSIEYGVSVLGAPVVMVLGHSHCGAVEAATKIVTEQAVYPGSIADMVQPILPAVLRAQRIGGDLLAQSVRLNVEAVLADIANSSPIITEATQAGRARLVGGVYDLASGQVEYLG